MRVVPEKIAAALAGGVTTLAHVWRFTRRDGAVFGFTDHDLPLLFDDLVCEPENGLKAGVVEKSAGLASDTASVQGALSSNAIAEADLTRGLWDGARVDVYRVDWRDPSQRLHLFAGNLGEISRGTDAFEAELRGLQASLSKPVGRVFSRYCDADLGDLRCGMAVDAPPFRAEGVVAAVRTQTAFRADGLGSFGAGWFSRGRLLWESGAAAEVAAHGLEDGAAIVELASASPDIAAGARFTIVAGCDKSFETCCRKFSNQINFRGFPHMPGNDALLAGPPQGGPMDGGSRFR